jgi:bacterioferritin-associated ferredoxin
LYICICNGLRQRDAHAAIEAGASKPAQIFRHHQCRPQCAKCVCELRRMIQDRQEALRYAAE